MRIGIITLPLHINYGGFLQNYALQVVLKQLGHDPITLNQRPRHKNIKEHLDSIVFPNIKTFILSIIGKRGNRPYMHLHRGKMKILLWEKSTYFFDKYINHTPQLIPNKDFKGICDRYNLKAIIVGSDQVWRPRYVENLSINYLAFASSNSVKKLSYAASFGTDLWEYSEKDTAKCKGYIDDFSLVTVREKAAIALCKDHFNVNAFQVLDPTLLLEKEDYVQLIKEEHEPESDGNLFCYILDNTTQKMNFVQIVANNTGFKPFFVNIGANPTYHTAGYIKSHLELFQNSSITKWIRGFMDADMVIADSFHAVAFSIIFNKPFWVIGNKKRGLSRFLSILELFHLEDRLLDESELNEDFDWNKTIIWDDVNMIRRELKNKSIELLKNELTV